MIQLLMDVETLLLTPTTPPHLRIWTAKLYQLTLPFFSLLVYLRYRTLL